MVKKSCLLVDSYGLSVPDLLPLCVGFSFKLFKFLSILEDLMAEERLRVGDSFVALFIFY